MNAKQIKNLVKPDNQSTTTFNAFKRFLKIKSELSNEQLAIVSFEAWDEAYKRGGKEAIQTTLESDK